MIPALCNGKTYNIVIVRLKLEPISETLQVWCDGMTLGPTRRNYIVRYLYGGCEWPPGSGVTKHVHEYVANIQEKKETRYDTEFCKLTVIDDASRPCGDRVQTPFAGCLVPKCPTRSTRGLGLVSGRSSSL